MYIIFKKLKLNLFFLNKRNQIDTYNIFKLRAKLWNNDSKTAREVVKHRVAKTPMKL